MEATALPFQAVGKRTVTKQTGQVSMLAAAGIQCDPLLALCYAGSERWSGGRRCALRQTRTLEDLIPKLSYDGGN